MAKKKHFTKQTDFELSLSDLLKTKAGRTVMWHYMESCRVFGSVYADGQKIYYNEGMRNVGLQILADIQRILPDSYLQMIKEQQLTEETKDGRGCENGDTGGDEN